VGGMPSLDTRRGQASEEGGGGSDEVFWTTDDLG